MPVDRRSAALLSILSSVVSPIVIVVFGEVELLLFLPTISRNLSTECSFSRTVSAVVTHPEHARQSTMLAVTFLVLLPPLLLPNGLLDEPPRRPPGFTRRLRTIPSVVTSPPLLLLRRAALSSPISFVV